jgi:hypothetical protein
MGRSKRGPIAELIRNRVCRLSESDRDSVGNGRRRRRRGLVRAEHFHQRQRASLLLREPGKAPSTRELLVFAVASKLVMAAKPRYAEADFRTQIIKIRDPYL